MKRTKQLRLSHLLIVLAILATLVFPGGTALAAVVGQSATPEPGVAAPDLPEAGEPYVPVEVLPLAEGSDAPAIMAEEMADFAPERPDLAPPTRTEDVAESVESKGPIIGEDPSVTDPANVDEAAQRAADAVALEANTAFVPGQPPVVDGVPVGPVPLVAAVPGAKTSQTEQVPADYLPQGLSPSAPTASYRFVRPGYSNTNNCINNWCGTINYAINQANPGDTIVIFPGVYRETVTVNKNLTLIRVWQETGTVTIDGSHLRRNFIISDNVTASIADMYIQYGQGDGSGGGGGILVGTGANLTLNSGVVVGWNSTSGHGGGIHLLSNSRLTMNDGSWVFTNTAPNGSGGGIWASTGSITTIKGVVAANSSGALGGGVFADGSSSVTVGSTGRIGLSGSPNRAGTSGGGLFARSTSTITVQNGGRIQYNTAPNNGGGLYGEGSSTINLESGGSVNNNQASGNGGGVILANSATLNVAAGASIANNSATGIGGGVYSYSSATVNLRGAISDNTATHGGGMYLSGGTMNFYSGAAVTRNAATNGQGGGINADSVTLTINGAITGNTSTQCGGGLRAEGGTITVGTTGRIGGYNLGNSSANYGGGMCVTGGSLTVNNGGRVEGNVASAGHGGGIYAENETVVIDGVVAFNVASKSDNSGVGGGLYAWKSTVSVGSTGRFQSDVYGNRNRAGSGGAIFVEGTSTLLLQEGSQVVNAQAANSGGGVYAQDTTVTINGTLAGNIANYGGGLWSQRITLTVGATGVVGGAGAGNTANVDGGGLVVLGTGATTINGSVLNNYAEHNAGGIFAAHPVTLHGVVSGNRANQFNGGGIYISGSTLTLDGKVTGNHSGGHGGGIYSTGSVFTLEAAGVLGEVGAGNVAAGAGGGLLLVGGSGTIRGSIAYNQGGGGGGGVYSTAPLTLASGARMANNTSTEHGGGVYLDGAASRLTLPAGAEIRDNSTGVNYVGGGIFANGGGTVVVDGIVAGNRAGSGGGIYANPGARMTVGSTGVIGQQGAPNQAMNGGGRGGGMSLHGATTVISGTVSYNTSAGMGGGLVIAGGTVTLRGAAIHHNSAVSWGGGIHQWSTSATVSMINTTISNNSANWGGGIFNESAQDLKFVTLANNSATSGGANAYNHVSGRMTVFATILADPQLRANCGGNPFLSPLGFNRISDNSCLAAPHEDDRQDIPIDLGALIDNGGTTLTHLPNSRSANATNIVDIMPAATCASIFAPAAATDQRGETRPILGLRGAGFDTIAKCDAGAVELGVEIHFVCGPPLTPIADNQDRCAYTTISEALDVAQDGDTVVISGIVNERSTISVPNLTIRGPRAWEITPGTHMGFVQGGPTAPTNTSGAPIFTIPAGIKVTIEELNIRNGSSGNGGAIENAGSLDLKGVTISQSRALSGAAVYNSGILTVTNSTLISNTATNGAALFNAGAGTAQIDHVTFSANTGGSIHNNNGAANSASVAGSLFVGSGGQCGGDVADGGFNLLFGGTCAGVTPISTADPLLGPLRDNGGPTLTRAITDASSPAATLGPDAATCTVDTDQRGRIRPLNLNGDPGGKCDIGAVEFGSVELTLCQNCSEDASAGRFLDLQSAINAAMAGDVISIEAGAYTGNFTLYKDVTLQHAGIDITGLSQEQPLDVRAILQASELSVTEQNRLGTAAGTILTVQGYALNPSTGALTTTTDISVTLRGLTLRNGLSRTGGAIVNLGSLAVYTSTIAENGAVNSYDNAGAIVSGEAAKARGGAIFTSGSLTLDRTTISGNISEYYAGAIYVAGGSTVSAKATVEVQSSTLADNRAARLPDQHLAGVNDDAMVVPTLTVKSGDEIRFESRSAQAHTLDVSPGAGVTCQVSQIVVPLLGVGPSTPLICTVDSSTGSRVVTVTDSANSAITLDITVQAVGFVPVGHLVRAVGYSQSNFAGSILAKSAGSGENCFATDLNSRFKSAGYNLTNDRSCQGTNSQATDAILAGSTLASLKLGPLQDNNQIDFQANTVSGYTYAHALYPDSPAIDVIPPAVCQASTLLNVDLSSGGASTIAVGDTVAWQFSRAATVVFNDGENNPRFVSVPASGSSEEMQFSVPGDYAYRAYDAATRAQIATGTIVVAAKVQSTDQRGVSLPQRGTTRAYNCDMGAVEFQPWTVGQPLPRPPIALGDAVPDWTGVADVQSYHLWSSATSQDFALRPTPNNGDADLKATEMVTVKWETSTDSTYSVKIDQVGVIEWPDDPQIHVAQVPVNLNHNGVKDGYLVSAARAFEGRISEDEKAGTILSLGVFTRTLLPVADPASDGDSYSVIQLAKGTQASAAVKVLVVKSVDWNAAGVRDMRIERSVCTIGSELTYASFSDGFGTLAGHADPQEKAGWILSGDTFDGVMTEADLVLAQNTVDGLLPPAFVRATREGPIIPILESAPTVFADTNLATGGHDLEVAWYRPDNRNVAWPVKSVGYRCEWPTNPPQIVIASELGSEIAAQPVLDSASFANLTVYHQTDSTLPGYSPNWEHALLSSSNLGNSAPAFYALRTDLYDRDTVVAEKQSYALLKYLDAQDENRSKIGVYKVVLTRDPAPITPVNRVDGTVTILPPGARIATAVDAPLATEALTVTVRPGSGSVADGVTLTLPIEVIGVKNLHAITASLAYDPAKLFPAQCLTNRLSFVEAPTGLTAVSSSPTRPGFVVKMRADLAAGTDVSYAWDFGDGSTRIAGSAVSTVYALAGTYPVTVTATNGAFPGVSATTSIVVAADAVPGVLPADPTTGCRIVDYLFNVDKETYRFDLNSQNLPAPLVDRFAVVGIALSGAAKVILKETDSRWQISDGADLYTLIQRGELIHVYQGDRAIVDQMDTLTFLMQARSKHGASGSLVLGDVSFVTAGSGSGATTLAMTAADLAGPDYSELKFNITAGNPVFAPTPMRSLLDVQICSQSKAADVAAPPFWKDFKGALWARAAGDMDVLYFYPLQPGFYLSAVHATEMGLNANETNRVGQCVPWMDKLSAGTVNFSDFPTTGVNTKVLPVAYHAEWPELPPLLTVGETVYERSKAGVSGVANQAAVTRIYDDMAPGAWNNTSGQIVITGTEVMASVAQLIDPMGELSVPMKLKINGNFSLPTTIKTQRLLFGGGLSIVGTVDNEISLPFALRSRITYNDNTGELVLKGYYDGTSPEYIKGDPLLLLNVLSLSDKTRLESLCTDGSADCTTYLNAVTELYHLSQNPRQVDLCRDSDGWIANATTGRAANQTAKASGMQSCFTQNSVEFYRDGKPDEAFLIGVQDKNNDGYPEPYEGLGKGKALSAGNAAGTGFITLAYNNDDSLGGLPVSLQVIQVGCTLDAQGEDSTYRGNLLTIKSDNLFDEKLTLRHTGDFGGQPDLFTFDWWIAEVDDTGVSPSVLPSSYPWKAWTKIEPGASALGPEITIEGANPTTLSDNWLIARYKGYAACGNQVRYSAFAGDPSAKPSEVRAQLAQGWIKRVTNALNPFDARVDDFVSAPVNSTVDMVRQAGQRYEGPVAMNADPDNLNSMGLIEAYETVLDRGKALSINSNINHAGANAALLNVTTRIADLYMLLAGDAYNDALDPTVGLGTDSVLGIQASSVYAFMNQFNAAQFGLIDEELALLRGRDETLGGVAAAPSYNRLTWNFTNGTGEVAYVQNYNVKDWNEDGFVNEADGALMYPQGHGDAWGQYLTAIQTYYELLRHPFYTWSPRAEPISVAGAPVVVDYYDESRFAVAAANKAKMGSEIVDLTYRKYYADPESQPYIDTHVDASDDQLRAWGVADWAVRAGQGAYFDWIVANAILPPEDDRFQDVRKIDRTTVTEIGEIAAQYQAVAQELDDADNGVNPLGLLPNALLFDLDPSLVADGETHFEQIYQRAIASLDITSAFFDYANQSKVAQRESQNDQRSFIQGIIDEDTALINDLIELFGYAYDADIGINGTYPDGYQGPDIYNYDLYDRNALTDAQKRCQSGDPCSTETKTFLVGYTPLTCLGSFVTPLDHDITTGTTVADICPGVNLSTSSNVTITYQVGIGLDAGRGRFKPASWPESSARAAPGEIQNSLQGLTEARLNYEMAIQAYENHVEAMDEKQIAIKDRAAVLKKEKNLSESSQSLINVINFLVLGLKETAFLSAQLDEDARAVSDAASECLPTAVGLATDATAPGRCTILFAGAASGGIMSGLEIAAQIAGDLAEYGLRVDELELGISLFEQESDFELRQLGREMQEMIRQERELRLALFMAWDQVGDAQGGYDQTRQRAFRTLQTLIRLRQRWAGQITEQRYGDMAYRIFQNDALQKYRKQFDMAQIYTYLTAAAYDYETNLAVGNTASGNAFLREIVGLRSLGGLTQQARPDGTVIPIAGMPGLADPLARMRENFEVLKGQMGFNNPQPEAKQFSLRQELFRLRDDSDVAWRQELARYYTPNIYANDAVARLAKRPFGETGATPGFVIPFGSVVSQGLNYFGLPLGGGDNTFNPTQFTTKISAAGIWLEGYDGDRLSASPYVYLLPAGQDIMRPKDTNGQLRYWQIAEQLLPMPHAIGQGDMENPDWIPSINGLDGQLYDVKTHAAMAAFPYDDGLEIGPATTSSRLIGRSVWNSQWMLVIPGPTLLADPDLGIDYFIQDVTDILLYFETYSYAGTVAQ